MDNYKQTEIWKRTLGMHNVSDGYEIHRDFLRIEYENVRNRAAIMASEISRSMPDYTVHDITHCDALWECADRLVPFNMEINPAEAFVLGVSFLLHDLGMGIVAYSTSSDNIHSSLIWKDAAARLYRKKYGKCLPKKFFNKIDDDIAQKATQYAIRAMHAEQADRLALKSWKDDTGNTFYLIDNVELREAFGNIIGKIAYSHWCQVDNLSNLLGESLGALSRFPSNWEIDSVKLACILRISDAIQIDDRRAPLFLKILRNPNPESESHWVFQAKMYQPRIEKERLVFTSKSPFTLDEIDAWWLCYDTLKMINEELLNVDGLLSHTNRIRLNAFSVSNISDLQSLSKTIKVTGWTPVDSSIRVDNVGRLVNNIGGNQLYGNNYLVPLRELIQNASDAIRSRRILDKKDGTYGDIIVTISNDDQGEYVEVEDNGIGMSQRVLLGPFLDFGQSFWGSDLMHQELPGLEAEGFVPTGKYGIGFFSVFMWGDHVKIITNKFDKGRKDTCVLEFGNGAYSRPILREARNDEIITNGGTRVRIWLNRCNIKGLFDENHKYKHMNASEQIESLCPSLDCNVFITTKGKKTKVIQANDWLEISPNNLVQRLMGKKRYDEFMQEIKDDSKIIESNMEIIYNKKGEVLGRALLYKDEYLSHQLNPRGIITVGGIASSSINGILGILLGESQRAARDDSLPIADELSMRKWIEHQTILVSKAIIDNTKQIGYAEIVKRFTQQTNDLVIAEYQGGALSFGELVKKVENENESEYIIVQDAAISMQNRYVDGCIYNSNVIWCSMGVTSIIGNYSNWSLRNEWPKWYGTLETMSLKGSVYEAICLAWKCTMKELRDSSFLSSDNKGYSAEVGHNGNKAIVLKHLDILKKPLTCPK